jgi:hypothetical protein
LALCGDYRRARGIRPAAQSAFNALMILRFMRDDAMTLRAQKDQTARRAEAKKVLRGFVVSFLSHQDGKNHGSIRNGDPHDLCRHDLCCNAFWAR